MNYCAFYDLDILLFFSSSEHSTQWRAISKGRLSADYLGSKLLTGFQNITQNVHFTSLIFIQTIFAGNKVKLQRVEGCEFYLYLIVYKYCPETMD